MRISAVYSLALAYEFISQFKQISSNSGLVHSMDLSFRFLNLFTSIIGMHWLAVIYCQPDNCFPACLARLPAATIP